MKKCLTLLLAVLSMFLLSSKVSAANNNEFYVNNVYSKGDGKYDVVVYDSTKDTLRLYVNDKDPVKAKVNKQGWATFQKVKLSGQSKISFDRKVKTFKYAPVNYVNFMTIDGDQVKLSTIGPKHTFEEFYKWSMSERYDGMLAAVGSAYQQIMTSCGSADRNFGATWTACMQKGYKDYLKPEVFVGENWTGDYITMFDYINDAQTQHNLYGDLSVASSEQYQKDMREAKKLYERIAVNS